MKKVLFLILSFIIITISLKSQSNGEVHVINHPNENMEMFATGISSSGEYITGYAGFSLNSFIWTKAGGLNQLDEGIGVSSAYAVSDNMIVTGQFPDSLYMYLNIEGINVPLLSAGYFYNNRWHSLGLKEGMIIEDLGGSLAEAISEDGTKIGGARKAVPIPGHGRLEPVIWTINGDESTPAVLDYPETGQGARIQAMSGDGTIVGGWAAPYNSSSPVIWVDGVLRYITDNGTIIEGEVNGISANGKYAALSANNLAAVYDVESDRLTIIGKKTGAMASSATGVSNDGIVVGYDQLGLMMDCEGFIYSEKFGRISIDEYLEELDIDVPQPVSFLTPMAISADGSKFVGFGYQNFIMKGWYIEITNHISGLNPARYISARELSRGNILISWEAPNNDDSNTFTGYNIYRNGIKINESPLTSTTYNDQALPNGTYTYKVTAVWNTSEESRPTSEASVNTALFEMPFFDDFSSNDYNEKYWNVLPVSERWFVSDFVGIMPPAFNYLISVGSTYSDTIVTPYINKGENSEINLSFNIAIPVDFEGLVTNEHFKVEVFNGTTWNEVASYVPLTSGNTVFEHRTYNISQWTASAEQIRVRFIAYGVNQGSYIVWSIDNVNIYGTDDGFVVEKPLHVSAYRTESGVINVNWADPGDVVNLSFLPDNGINGWIGNEGVQFIAANMYNSEDLTEFDGYKMTSISAHLSHTIQGGQMAEYKLVAFQGNQRVLYQDITTYNVNEWNTFELNEPVIIDASRPLYFGVEVVSHDPADWPVGYCSGVLTGNWDSMINVNDGRSNLISTDNGATWTTLTSFDIVYSLAITALLVSDDQATAKDRIIGYKIYRNGVSLLGDDGMGNDFITSLNSYTDYEFLSNEESCYEVSAYYTVQEESEKTEPVCVSTIASIDEISSGNSVNIYPNPSSGTVNIEVEKNSNITVVDVTGRIIENFNVNGNSSVVINQSTGVYFIQIESEGKTITQKIIIN